KMYLVGSIFLFIGAFMVYMTSPILQLLKRKEGKMILYVKVAGLVVAIIGAILLFLSDRPEVLEFLRIF
ncbi:MAG: hypothetical protein LRZ93_02075, partial [Clostridiales bacterium]|nr:hypothetical protein [Clostridiales bacterium]